MGNGSSRGSEDYYPSLPPVPLRAQSIQMPQQHALLPQYHPGSYNSYSANSYDMSRKRKPWYSFGRRKDRHRNQEWYRPFVSPEGPVIPPPPGFVYSQWGHQPMLVPRPVSNEPQHGPPQAGYVPAMVPDLIQQPVLPGQFNRRRSQRHQPSYPPPMMMPQPQVQSQSSSSATSPDSTGSPPFRPFVPLPRTRQRRPPTPPQNIMAMSPYRSSFQHLIHPSPETQSRVMEIISNPEKTNIRIAREEWKKQDEERDKELQERREQRERLLNGNVPFPVPVINPNTMPLDPRFMKKKKPRKSLFGSLRNAFTKIGGGGTDSNAGSSGTHPSMPTFPQPVMPPLVPSPEPSHVAAHSIAMPTPAVIPPPSLSVLRGEI